MAELAPEEIAPEETTLVAVASELVTLVGDEPLVVAASAVAEKVTFCGDIVEGMDEVSTLSVVIVKVGIARLVLRSEVRRFKKLTESRLMFFFSS